MFLSQVKRNLPRNVGFSGQLDDVAIQIVTFLLCLSRKNTLCYLFCKLWILYPILKYSMYILEISVESTRNSILNRKHEISAVSQSEFSPLRKIRKLWFIASRNPEVLTLRSVKWITKFKHSVESKGKYW